MDEVLPFLIVVACLAAVLGGFAWLAARVRRRGTAGAAIGAAMASYDEAFRVTAHESYHEIQVQTRRKAPLLSPDGPGTGDPGGRGSGERGAGGRPAGGPVRGPVRRRRGRTLRRWAAHLRG